MSTTTTKVCHSPLRSESHCLCWVTRARSSTDTAEPPAAPPDDKRTESESWKCLTEERNKTERAGFSKKQLSSGRYLMRHRCCAAALHQQERRQELKQFPLAEVMTASNKWGESSICELGVNMWPIQQQCPELTCGKPWVFSAWLKCLQFVHCQQNNSCPGTTTTKDTLYQVSCLITLLIIYYIHTEIISSVPPWVNFQKAGLVYSPISRSKCLWQPELLSCWSYFSRTNWGSFWQKLPGHRHLSGAAELPPSQPSGWI